MRGGARDEGQQHESRRRIADASQWLAGGVSSNFRLCISPTPLVFDRADGADILTVEGMARPDGSLHPIQAAFLQEHGLQCGFCTPGMIMRTHRLLQENPDPTDDEIRMGLSGNICRCTGYQNIVKAVRVAAGQLGARKEAAE